MPSIATTATSRSGTFEQVRAIITDYTGRSPADVTLETDLCADLGVAGDDADELFAKLDQAFEVDWGDLDLTIHFGTEGLGYPFPWSIKDSYWLYELQPCRVSDIVRAADTGQWPGTRRTRIPPQKEVELYVSCLLLNSASLCFFVCLVAFFMAAVTAA